MMNTNSNRESRVLTRYSIRMQPPATTFAYASVESVAGPQRIRALFCVVVLFALGGCESERVITDAKPVLPNDQVAAWNLLIGTWYSKQPLKEGGYRETIAAKYSDGTYKIRFRARHENGTVVDNTEIGVWGFSGGVHFTIFRGWVQEDSSVIPSDTSDPYNYDAYQVLKLTQDEFEYRTFAGRKHIFCEKSQRKFRFPD